ncbi:hypothetical protein CsatB_030512 [Cannabis sativa]|nr:hypothetical protein G4B88_011192 [Cannabis sativa]
MGETVRHRSNGVGSRNIEKNIAYTGWSNNHNHNYNPSSKTLSSSKHGVLKVSSKRSSSSSSSSQSLKWWWNEPEMKRQRRITSYKLYSAEANVKISFKKGIRWLGKKCTMIIRRI